MTANLWERFQKSANQHGDKVALRTQEATITYEKLLARVIEHAAYLQHQGVKPDDRVAVCLSRGVDMVVALLSILACGAAYIPLDKSYPETRVAKIIEESNATILLHELYSSTTSVTPYKAVHVSNDSVAYIIFTSGTTGTPKGVMIRHRNSLAMIDWALSFYSTSELSCVLASSSICFDISVFEIFVPLLAGGTVYIVENILALMDLKDSSLISLINTVPSAIAEIVLQNALPSSVETLNLAGEQLQQSLVDKIYQSSQVERIYNLYGPTETTTYSSVYLAKKNVEHHSVPIGRPIDGTSMMLIDESMQCVPKQVVGELVIGGAGLSAGYCNISDSHFIELSYKGKKELFYRTGDLAKLNASMQLEYMGRLDEQIKVRGYRIEPGEVSHFLMKLSGIKYAYVCTLDNFFEGNALIAYIISDNSSITRDEIDAALHARLPAYMIPSVIMFIDKIPTTVNGKIDKKSLPFPNDGNTEEKFCSANIEDEISKRLTCIWESLLPNVLIAQTSNFFHIGGHSLLATRLAAQIAKQFDVKCTINDIFDHPTINQQRIFVLNQEKLVMLKNNEVSMASSAHQILATQSQSRLWYLQKARNDVPISNIPIVIEVHGALNHSVLQKCFTDIIRRHKILRTNYQIIDNKLMQIVNETFSFRLPVIHCEGETDVEFESSLADEANKNFNLEHDLMLRATLYVRSENKNILLMTQHHIASDAWSMNILIKEFSQLYTAFLQGQDSPFQEPSFQYLDYSEWVRQNYDEKSRSADIDYWRKKLDDAPNHINLPFDFDRPERMQYKGNFFRVEIEKSLVDKLKGLSQSYSGTLFTTLFSAYFLLLHRFSRQKDITIGFLSANRSEIELHDMLGFFVNTLVARLQLDSSMDLRTLLISVRDEVKKSLEHQSLPFDEMVDALKPNRSTNQHPYFQVLFSLQNALDQKLSLGNTDVNVYEYDRGISKFDLTLSWVESDGMLHGIFEYSSELFRKETIQEFAAAYNQLLQSFCADLSMDLGHVNLVNDATYKRLVIDNNNVTKAYPTISIGQQFDKVVANCSECVAIAAGDQQITYSELNEKANQLANYLKENGVEAQSVIGVFLPKSLEAMISILAITKLNAVYVALDCRWPNERLDFILDDAGINTILCLSKDCDALPARMDSYIIKLDEQFDEIVKCPTSFESNAGIHDAELPCYIAYTSGSTGKPKGVVIKQQGVMRLVLDTNYVTLDKNTILLQVSPLYFDGSTFDIWGTLLNGGKLVLMPDGLPEINKMISLINTQSVNTLFITTQLFNTLVDHRLMDLSGITQLLFGGEVASIHHVSQFKQAFPNSHISNIYGPTECTTFALYFPILDDFDKTKPIPLGKPITNTYMLVLDEYLNICPPGLSGQLYLGGPGLAKSYLNAPEQTLEKFIMNPFKEIPSTRLYATGDLVRYDAAGDIAFMGRMDEQVKIRGHRIEIQECEKVIRALDCIRGAVVILQNPETLLVAYVIANEGTDDVDVTSQLRSKMPDYMIPDAIVFLEKYPLNENGKVDKLSLPRYEFQHRGNNKVDVEKDDASTVIYRIWSSVLEDDEITYEDNFFDIGGNSLKIVQVLEQLQQHYSNDQDVLEKLDITTLFQYSTLQDLANYIAEHAHSEEATNNKRKVRQKEKRKEAVVETT